MKNDDLYNLCFSCLIDGCGEHQPITEEEAEYTLRCWKEEGCDLPELDGVSAKEFADIWNQVFYQLHFQA